MAFCSRLLESYLKNHELLSLQDSALSSTYDDHTHTTVVLISETLYSGFKECFTIP